jgi:uncharacterized membrane protein YdbT with pleckstrin-like domain
MKNHYLHNLLGDQEKIILATHQHWFVLFRSIFLEVIISIIIAAGVTAVWLLWLPTNPLIVLGYLFLIIPLVSMMHDIFLWANQDYIVTNMRVIQLSGIFNKNVTDSSLEKVNDVKMSQSFWGRIFDFGDVEILTGSELGVNLFKTIGNPVSFKTSMLNAKEKLEGRFTQPDIVATPDVPALIEKLDKLRQQGIITEAEFQNKKSELLSKM